MQGKFGEYQVIITEDGSPTLYGSHFDENCHSLSGAYGETVYNFIEKTNLIDRFRKNKKISILEVGFGTGLGFLATIDQCQKKLGDDFFLDFTSLEIDPELPNIASELWSTTELFSEKIRNLYSNLEKSEQGFSLKNNLSELIVLTGDARETIRDIPDQSIDVIYQDAFSPKKNPSLWELEWFHQLYRVLKTDGVLSTYSSSLSIRENMQAAGFNLSNAKGYGKKRTMTVATK